MVYWKTARTVPGQTQADLEWARQRQAAEKIVYSRTLAEPRGLPTRIERKFDPAAVRQLKGGASGGAGKRFFPDRVRLKLELVDEHRFRSGRVFLRYAVRN